MYKIKRNFQTDYIVRAYSVEDESLVGDIQLRQINDTLFQIDFFRVKETHRRSGVGREILDAAIEEVIAIGGKELYVYSQSNPFEGDSEVDSPTLTKIGEALGFTCAPVIQEFWFQKLTRRIG